MQIRAIRIRIRILDPDRYPNHPQNLSDWSLARAQASESFIQICLFLLE